MRNTGTEAEALSKTQKTFYLDDDLISLLDLLQKRTGASFTRQVTAAVLQYLFERPEGPDPSWMELAVGLDDGNLSIDDVLQDRESAASAEEDFMLNLKIEPHPKVPGKSCDDMRDHLCQRAENVVKAWAAMREPVKMSAIIRIMRFWKGQHNPLAKSKDQSRESEAGTDNE